MDKISPMTVEELETHLPDIENDIRKIVNYHFWREDERNDMYQNVMLTLVKSCHTFDTSKEVPFSHWVCKVASRRCKGHIRQIITRRNITKLVSMTPSEDSDLQCLFEPESKETPLDETIVHRDKMDIVKQAVEMLDPTEKLIVKLHSYKMTDQEIIDMMELTHSTERMRQKREKAMFKLRKILETEFKVTEADF